MAMSRGKRLYRGFLREISDLRESGEARGLRRFDVILSENREMYVEGDLRIEEYGESLIRLSANGTKITVSGRGLFMGCFRRNVVRIGGTITDLSFENLENYENLEKHGR